MPGVDGSAPNKMTKNQDKDVTDWFNLSVIDVPDKSDKTQCEHTVRRRPLDCVALYHRHVIRSA